MVSESHFLLHVALPWRKMLTTMCLHDCTCSYVLLLLLSNSPLLLAGKQIQGKVTTTISRGRLVWHDGKLDVPKGSGRFIPMAPFGSLFDGLERQGPSTVVQLVRSFASRQGPTPVIRLQGSSEGAAAGVMSGQQQPGREDL